MTRARWARGTIRAISDFDEATRAHAGPTGTRREHAVLRLLGGAPEQLAGTLYGTIVVLAIVAAGSSPHAADAWQLLELVASSSIVLWVAHVYAHGLAESVREGHRLTAMELGDVAEREASIVLAALTPMIALTLGALHVMSERSAVWLAIGLCLATLAVEALRYAALERLTVGAAVLTVATNVSIGVLIVVLKIQVGH